MTRQTHRLAVYVQGRPQPAGSKDAYRSPNGRIRVVDSNPQARAWKQHVAAATQTAMQNAELATTAAAVRVELLFSMPRPKTHYGTGRNTRTVKPSAPIFHTTRPDVDKISRAVLDALTGIVWNDDAQVNRKTAAKYWDHPEHAGVHIRAEWQDPGDA